MGNITKVIQEVVQLFLLSLKDETTYGNYNKTQSGFCVFYQMCLTLGFQADLYDTNTKVN